MEQAQELQALIVRSAKEIGLTIEDPQVGQFIRYLAQLLEWNKTINLTAIIEPKAIVIKHFIDSLAALVATNFPEQALVLDVGSGGGFPGIPLKIMRPDLRLILIEPVQKKCAFLNSVIGLLKLQKISTFNGTIEQYANSPLQPIVDMIVLRALKFEDVRAQAPALLAPKGKIVLYRTETVQSHELGDGFHLATAATFLLPYESGKRVIAVLEKSNA
ncbi:MAG: Ribosomal RNA small subunit methyltransferase G [Nitrospira sp.]|nr:Ribosomal RNA small subunit methyltransferase G [Nitrospira sp.]